MTHRRARNAMALLFKLPLVGAMLEALVVFGGVALGIVRDPGDFLPRFCRRPDSTWTAGVEIFLAGLSLSWAILVLRLGDVPGTASAAVHTLGAGLLAILQIPVMHIAFRLFGYDGGLRPGGLLWLSMFGIHAVVVALVYRPALAGGPLVIFACAAVAASTLMLIWIRRVYGLSWARTALAVGLGYAVSAPIALMAVEPLLRLLEPAFTALGRLA